MAKSTPYSEPGKIAKCPHCDQLVYEVFASEVPKNNAFICGTENCAGSTGDLTYETLKWSGMTNA
jgi:hypothetical protein